MSLANLHYQEPTQPVPKGPEFTPAEYNTDPDVLLEGSVDVPDRPRPSHLFTRRARRPVVFFLQPVEWWAAADFLASNLRIAREDGIPKGRFIPQDYRRNIDVPPTQSYGDLVGAMDGVAPYGLD